MKYNEAKVFNLINLTSNVQQNVLKWLYIAQTTNWLHSQEINHWIIHKNHIKGLSLCAHRRRRLFLKSSWNFFNFLRRESKRARRIGKSRATLRSAFSFMRKTSRWWKKEMKNQSHPRKRETTPRFGSPTFLTRWFSRENFPKRKRLDLFFSVGGRNLISRFRVGW